MPISTVPVTGSVAPPDGSSFASGELVFKLSAPDTEGGVAIATETVATLVAGALPGGFVLWRNTAGIRGTFYTVDLRVLVNQGNNGAGQPILTRRAWRLGNIQTGNAASYTLTELLNNPVPDQPGWNINLDPEEYAALLDRLDDMEARGELSVPAYDTLAQFEANSTASMSTASVAGQLVVADANGPIQAASLRKFSPVGGRLDILLAGTESELDSDFAGRAAQMFLDCAARGWTAVIGPSADPYEWNRITVDLTADLRIDLSGANLYPRQDFDDFVCDGVVNEFVLGSWFTGNLADCSSVFITGNRTYAGALTDPSTQFEVISGNRIRRKEAFGGAPAGGQTLRIGNRWQAMRFTSSNRSRMWLRGGFMELQRRGYIPTKASGSAFGFQGMGGVFWDGAPRVINSGGDFTGTLLNQRSDSAFVFNDCWNKEIHGLIAHGMGDLGLYDTGGGDAVAPTDDGFGLKMIGGYINRCANGMKAIRQSATVNITGTLFRECVTGILNSDLGLNDAGRNFDVRANFVNIARRALDLRNTDSCVVTATIEDWGYMPGDANTDYTTMNGIDDSAAVSMSDCKGVDLTLQIAQRSRPTKASRPAIQVVSGTAQGNRITATIRNASTGLRETGGTGATEFGGQYTLTCIGVTTPLVLSSASNSEFTYHQLTGDPISGDVIVTNKPSGMTRADAVTAHAAGVRIPNGRIVTIEGLQYRGVTGSTVIADLPGLVPHGDWTFGHWGAAPSATATANTAAFRSAMDAVMAVLRDQGGTGLTIRLQSGVYLVNNELLSDDFQSKWWAQTNLGKQKFIAVEGDPAGTSEIRVDTSWLSGVRNTTNGNQRTSGPFSGAPSPAALWPVMASKTAAPAAFTLRDLRMRGTGTPGKDPIPIFMANELDAKSSGLHVVNFANWGEVIMGTFNSAHVLNHFENCGTQPVESGRVLGSPAGYPSNTRVKFLNTSGTSTLLAKAAIAFDTYAINDPVPFFEAAHVGKVMMVHQGASASGVGQPLAMTISSISGDKTTATYTPVNPSSVLRTVDNTAASFMPVRFTSTAGSAVITLSAPVILGRGAADMIGHMVAALKAGSNADMTIDTLVSRIVAVGSGNDTDGYSQLTLASAAKNAVTDVLLFSAGHACVSDETCRAADSTWNANDTDWVQCRYEHSGGYVDGNSAGSCQFIVQDPGEAVQYVACKFHGANTVRGQFASEAHCVVDSSFGLDLIGTDFTHFSHGPGLVRFMGGRQSTRLNGVSLGSWQQPANWIGYYLDPPSGYTASTWHVLDDKQTRVKNTSFPRLSQGLWGGRAGLTKGNLLDVRFNDQTQLWDEALLLTSADNLNDFVTPMSGYWQTSVPTNGPGAFPNYASFRVEKYENTIVQRVYDFDNRYSYVRERFSGTWTAWRSDEPLLLTSSTNLNDLNYPMTGYWQTSVPTNAPGSTPNYSSITVEKYENTIVQRVYDFDNRYSYVRERFSGTWTAWRSDEPLLLTSSTNLNDLNYPMTGYWHTSVPTNAPGSTPNYSSITVEKFAATIVQTVYDIDNRYAFVREFFSSAWTAWRFVGSPPSSNTTNMTNAANLINASLGKHAGMLVRNATDSKLYYATGSAATSTWVSADGATTITPV